MSMATSKSQTTPTMRTTQDQIAPASAWPQGLQWLLVGALAAGAAVLAAHRATGAAHFALLSGFAVLLVLLAVCDARSMLLPNRLIYPGLLAALLCAGAWPDHSWQSSLAGGAAAGAAMLVLFVLLPGFGAGDVKLCALIGLLVGWPHAGTALVTGMVFNGLLAGAGLLLRRLRLSGAMPYGPGLIAAALLVLLVSRS